MRPVGIRERAAAHPQLRYAPNGNDYVFATSREAVERVAQAIGRRSGVYYRADFGVWVLRIRAPRHKRAVRRLFGREGRSHAEDGLLAGGAGDQGADPKDLGLRGGDGI